MKIIKVISILAIAVMLSSLAGAALAADAKSLDSTLMDTMDMSVTEWMKTSDTRNTFAALVIVELIVDNSGSDTDKITDIVASALADKHAYIGGSSKFVTALFFGSTGTVTVVYSPAGKTASWSYMDKSSAPAKVMSSLKTDGTFNSYYTLSAEKVVEVLQKVQSFVNK